MTAPTEPHVMQTYGRLPIALAHGRGCRVWDTDGREYLDALGGIGAFIGYSPYCVPTVVGGVKCVIVNEALRGLEPMAWDFVMNFARDNRLQLGEVCAPTQPPTAQM